VINLAWTTHSYQVIHIVRVFLSIPVRSGNAISVLDTIYILSQNSLPMITDCVLGALQIRRRVVDKRLNPGTVRSNSPSRHAQPMSTSPERSTARRSVGLSNCSDTTKREQEEAFRVAELLGDLGHPYTAKTLLDEFSSDPESDRR
jgi:hypothetical protein